MRELFCGVDVGTASARAGIFAADGSLLGRAEHPVAIRRPLPGHAEHSSEDIWAAVSAAVRAARRASGAGAEDVAGIGFDATCSLVVRGRDGRPLPVSEDGGTGWDTIVWLDHRAIAEADECTATGHPVLAHSGGVMSPEMQMPKLMWLKRNLPGTWAAAGMILDLADFLGWKATGSNARSQCTLACKWGYLPQEAPGWRRDFLDAVGLSDLFARTGLPPRAVPVATDIGPLTPEAADALGLTTRCRVGAGVIDAYAGALGLLGDGGGAAGEAALIAGTSSCVMAMSPQKLPFPGGWGPYLGAALPGFWIGEAGQSATGALLDHLIRWHAAGGEPDAAMHARLLRRVGELRAAEGDGFARRLHVLPDFHGNRSPLSDPHALGVISGLTLDASFDSLARLYWKACLAIAFGVRQIVETLNGGGHAIGTLHVAGGHARNPLLMALYADASGCRVVERPGDETILRGAAMIAATAAGSFPSLAAAGAAMRRPGRPRQPDPAARASHERDYRIFLEMQRQRRALDAIA